MSRLCLSCWWVMAASLTSCLPFGSPRPEPPSFEWRFYGADAASTRFAPLVQIDSTNFSRLRMIWRWRAPDVHIRRTENPDYPNSYNECTPLMVDGVLYVSTPYNIMAALDAATGRELWRFDPEAWKVESSWGVSRGVAYWSDGRQKRVLMGTSSDYLYSLDAAAGTPDPAFGDSGRVDLGQQLRRPVVDRYRYGVSSPPIVCRDVVIVGSMASEWGSGDIPEFMPLGDVRGFDVRTGELVWTFHTVPREGEFGNDTWENGSWKRHGGANVWAPMSADLELGYVYLPVSAPSNDFYGGERLGDNLFSSTIACLDCASGRRIWHYQIVRHDLWNYDPSAAPILMDMTVRGERIKAVVQLTKQAWAFAFDRITGEPVWPIEDRPVPQSTVPGERAAPTQPFPTWPLPYDRQGLTEDDLIDFTPELRQQALDIVAGYDIGELYTPVTERGMWMLPGDTGGVDWTGGAADPRGWIYVPSRTAPRGFGLKKADSTSFSRYAPVKYFPEGPEELPLVKPPYGRITAIDMNSGEHQWIAPTGPGPVDHPLLRQMDLPHLGWDTRTFVLATPTLLVTASETPDRIRWFDAGYYVDPERYLYAYDKDDGRFIARADLPANARGNPMTYETGGRQYIVVPVGGGWWSEPSEFIALAVPREGESLPSQGYERSDADHPSFYDAVAAFDGGDAATLKQLLADSPELAFATGFHDSTYEHPALRGAGLIHLVPGYPQRAKLPDNALDLAEVLLEAGADVNAVTPDSVTTLELFVDAEQPGWQGIDEQLLSRLFDAGADANHKNGFLLWKMLIRGGPRPERARLLAAAGARVDLRMAAGLNDSARVRQFFTDSGSLTADAGTAYRIPPPDAVGDGGLSDQEILDEALSFAAINGALAAVEVLLSRGADINAMPANFLWSGDAGRSALHQTVDLCLPGMARFLLDHGADPDLKEPRRESSARDWAMSWGCREVRKVFQETQVSE